MIIRLDQSFIQTLSQLGENFSGNDKQTLASNLDSKYGDIRSILRDKENKNTDFEATAIEIGKIDSRTFTLNLYKSNDSENDDIPLEVTQLLPTISKVRMDILATLHQKSSDDNLTYLKVGQVYDDGDIHSRYLEEIMEEEEGKRPPTS
ncbi:MAG TPA: hypothetical protein VD815_06210 [Candidatus Saccharimonadales bacterium]|nr:hypothetical protein [Candidatus Saccharimonadales bacterium]